MSYTASGLQFRDASPPGPPWLNTEAQLSTDLETHVEHHVRLVERHDAHALE